MQFHCMLSYTSRIVGPSLPKAQRVEAYEATSSVQYSLLGEALLRVTERVLFLVPPPPAESSCRGLSRNRAEPK